MRVLTCGFNFRNVDNFADVLLRIQAAGGQVAAVFYPNVLDPSHARMEQLPFPVLALRPVGHAALSLEELDALIAKALREFGPDVVLVDDMSFYPSDSIWGSVQRFAQANGRAAPPVVVFQHGLFVNWLHYNRKWACDEFFCFGARHRRQFWEQLQPRVFPVGLPKLDRIEALLSSCTDDGYALYIAQDTPRPEVLELVLNEYQQHSGLPLVIKPHPQWVHDYRIGERDGRRLARVGEDILPLIARARHVISSGSTSGLEALLMGKPFACLPSKSSGGFSDSPFLCPDFRGEKLHSLLQNQDPAATELFLDDVLGGRRFDSTERMLEQLEQTVERHSAKGRSSPRRDASTQPIRVFVGTEANQIVAHQVLEYSIRKHTSRPVEFFPMLDMPVPVPRDPANRTRTGFSFCRFLIPELCEYEGRAIYLDADMLVLSDIAELWDTPLGTRSLLCSVQELPDVWKHLPVTNRGRQFSVMLMDCSRLRWDIAALVRALNEGVYDYPKLVHQMCVVPESEIGDDMTVGWNHLERLVPGETRLVHYTVVPTQPWKCRDNPLFALWHRYYLEACAAGAVDKQDVLRGIELGYLLPELAQAFDERAPQRAPQRALAHRYQTALSMAKSQADRLREELEQASSQARTLPSLQKELRHLRRALERSKQQAAGLRRTWTWRVGRVVIAPIRAVKRAIRVLAFEERTRKPDATNPPTP
jgi:Glycosyl transferase family 8